MLDTLQNKNNISEETIFKYLLSKGEEQQELFRLAREKRKSFFPDDAVEVRSVIEVSNICRQKCNYCGMNVGSNRSRYTIDDKEVVEIAGSIYDKGRRVLFLESGENGSQKYIDHICRCLSTIKNKFSDLKVILCLGNLSFKQFEQLKNSGADRYILKFETSNPRLYENIRPGDTLDLRIEGIHRLIEAGFEVGTGNIIGLPGQELQDIVNDLLFLSQFKLSMASCSVFIPGKNTVYQDEPPGNMDIVLNFTALLRIMYPHTRIPTTSSLEKVKKGGLFLGLMAGANTVTIHEGTPAELIKDYPIYSTDRFIPDQENIKNIVEQAHLKFINYK